MDYNGNFLNCCSGVPEMEPLPETLPFPRNVSQRLRLLLP